MTMQVKYIVSVSSLTFFKSTLIVHTKGSKYFDFGREDLLDELLFFR